MTSSQHGEWSSTAIDAASHGAIAFVQIYYEAYDEPTRRGSELPQLFLPGSKIIWNGNPVLSDPSNLGNFLNNIPLTRHDLQTLDCHPVSALDPGRPPNSAPDLILNVTGSVLHGPTVMQSQQDPTKVAPQDHPRKFHEMFILRAAEQGEGLQPKRASPRTTFGSG